MKNTNQNYPEHKIMSVISSSDKEQQRIFTIKMFWTRKYDWNDYDDHRNNW